MQRRTQGLLLNNELERNWMVAQPRPRICLKQLKKTTKTSLDSRCLNSGLRECKGVLFRMYRVKLACIGIREVMGLADKVPPLKSESFTQCSSHLTPNSASAVQGPVR